MKIAIPEGLDLKVGAGETTEVLVKAKVTDDGNLELLEMDGIPLPMEEEVEVEAEVEGEDLDAMIAEMSAEEAGAAEAEAEIPSLEVFAASKAKK